MKNAYQELEERAENPQKLLAIPSKELKTEVKGVDKKFEDFGINNETSRRIREKKLNLDKEREEVRTKVAQQSVMNLLIQLFMPFKIISYNTLVKVAKDHNLYLSSLSFYNKPIAVENLEELQIFKEKMHSNIENLSRLKQNFPQGNYFSFDYDNLTSVAYIDFKNYFNVAAPLTHFKFVDKWDRPVNVKKIGREIKKFEKTPKFTYKAKLNPGKIVMDPIIYAPFFYLGKLYAFVVTAWDEVADDSRILSQL